MTERARWDGRGRRSWRCLATSLLRAAGQRWLAVGLSMLAGCGTESGTTVTESDPQVGDTADCSAAECEPADGGAAGRGAARAAGDRGTLETKSAPAAERDPYAKRRQRMVDIQLRGRDITDQRVLGAMRQVPRHQFVPPAGRSWAYYDSPLPIGHEQTISQPYIVALMTQLADPAATDRALDVGTGSGYQAAVLAELVEHVYSIEIVAPLAEQAQQRLAELGYGNVNVRHGDGYLGWPEEAPFDIIIVAAAPEVIPQPLIDQLAPGGRLVIPVGGTRQVLTVVERRPDGKIQKRKVAPVMFVPMTGEAQAPTK